MKRFPTMYWLAAAARWSAWLIVCVALWHGGAFTSADVDAWALLWLAYSTVYLSLWTMLLPKLLSRLSDGSVVVLYDLLLSMIPVWLVDGWASPFLPLALSAIVIPAARRGWRGGMLIAAVFLALDQLVLWTNTPNPWELASTGHSLALLGRTMLPFGVAAAVCSGRHVRHVDRRKAAQRPDPQAVQWEYPNVRSMLESAGIEGQQRYERGNDEAPLARVSSKTRVGQPTLERQSAASVQAALEHLAPELQAATLSVSLQVEGDERIVPQQIHDLLTRAIEIALDNVITHAHARSASVLVGITPDVALLRVVDDGIGLFDGTAEPPGFHQLKRLRFRAQELGGTLRVDEREEGGVVLELQVPLVL